MSHFNGLTPAEAERLAMLAEECGEVIQAVGKILRHGYESKHPDTGVTNRDHLTKEMDDVMAVTLMMQWNTAKPDMPNLASTNLEEVVQRKLSFTHHQKD